MKKAPASGKKRKKQNEADMPSADITVLNNNKSDKHPVMRISQATNGTVTPNGGIKNAATASLTAKVLEEEKEKHKRRKLGGNDNLKSLFSSDNGVPKKNGDFMTRGFSIPAGAKR